MNSLKQHRFENIIEECTPMVLRLAMGVLHNREDARDICQEVFILLFQTEGIDNPTGWLYRTTIHRAINLKKKNQRRLQRENTALKPVQSEEQPSHKLEQHEQLIHLQNAIAELPEGQRSIFLLRHQAQMPIKEIAEQLNISEGTVKKQLSRTLQRLRLCLDKKKTG